MDLNSQNKVLAAGFYILRKDDHPQPRIKAKMVPGQDWKTYKKYSTKAERNRAFELLMKDEKIISD